MKVSLRPAKTRPTPPPALGTEGPQLVLGGVDPIRPVIRPDASTLFGPRSALLASSQGPLLVSDTGHHRILVYPERPTRDQAPAEFVIGQPDFHSEARNAGGDHASASTLNVPTGLARWGRGLVVADAWNNRVLVWQTMPERSFQPADIVLGQGDFADQRPNRGRPGPGADTLHWPFQVMVHEGRLYVADAGNRRVLVWKRLPERSGEPADFALGQVDLTSRSDNGGGSASASSLRWPHDLAVTGGNLMVADAGNNRILVWEGLPDTFDAPAAGVLGQDDFTQTEHNRGVYWPSARSFNMPYALSGADGGELLVADTANSRILRFEGPFRTGSDAVGLTGQPDFQKKGDNRNKLPVRDSLCWPYGLKVQGTTAVVADTGNHRVLLWERPDDAR